MGHTDLHFFDFKTNFDGDFFPSFFNFVPNLYLEAYSFLLKLSTVFYSSEFAIINFFEVGGFMQLFQPIKEVRTEIASSDFSSEFGT